MDTIVLEFSKEEIKDNAEMWLNLTDEAFQFMIGTMKKQAKASSKTRVPDVSGNTNADLLETVRSGFKEMRTRSD